MNIAVKIAASSVSVDVDILGALKAQIADLEVQAKKISDNLKARGAGDYAGELFDANVAEIAGSESPDPKAMEEKLREMGVDGRWFAKNMKTRAASMRITVKARKA